ncbi:cation:proton antiporter [Parasediminibacterium sp. JCM 36343]|uniref:cation:proton antiporter n=1 Tax=Parasediminibacterium sp. JCM 36343 TaxID=3374279 RepID=UPI00397C1B33
MNLYYLISLLVILSAVFAYINTRLLKLPLTIGLMLLSTIFSVGLLAVNQFFPSTLTPVTTAIKTIDFSAVVLNVLLSFLLFAGSMHTDYRQLQQNRKSIILFALVSVLLCTVLAGAALYFLTSFFGTPINFLYCLLFGAIVSPTDPIAVLGILTKANVPKSAEINIVGESLFNDGIGVVVFVSLLALIEKGSGHIQAWDMPLVFLQQAVGGIGLGFILGYIIFFLLKSIDDYETEVMITLAVVMGGNWVAHIADVSGPLAMVVAGLITGYKVKKEVMSDVTMMYVEKFWHLIDVLMNAILFVLMGLKILSIHFEWGYLLVALAIIPLLLLCRYLSLAIPYQISKQWLDVSPKTILLMTWGGLRGGLSIAMALSLSPSFAVKDELVFITYIIVMFSIFVQGLTVEKVAKKIYGHR